MIELIIQGTIFDIGMIYGLGTMNNIVGNAINRRNNTFASDYESLEGRANEILQRFIDAFD
jgi:hypothetical protein